MSVYSLLMEKLNQKVHVISDFDLVERLRFGDEVAFEMLYDRYKTQIAQNLLRLLKSESMVEDLLHDLFLKIWENRSQLDQNLSFRAYLYRIAHNMVIDFFRKAAKIKSFEKHLAVNQNLSYTHIEEIFDDHQKRDFLNKILESLSPQSRLVFKLCKLEGKSYEEISNLLGISVNTISNHLVKANKHIRAQLSGSSYFQCLIAILIASAVRF